MRIHTFRTSRLPRAPWWALGLCMGWLVLVAWVRYLEQRTGLTPETCLIHGVFEVPCPTCGSTRVVSHLLAGRLLEALRLNPMVFFGLVGGTLALAIRMATGGWFRLEMNEVERRITLIGGLALLMLNWAWLFRVQ